MNDNAPEFLRLPYYAAVQAEAPLGTVIYRVEATDRDHGVNGEVTYRLEEPHPNFQVRPSSWSRLPTQHSDF